MPASVSFSRRRQVSSWVALSVLLGGTFRPLGGVNYGFRSLAKATELSRQGKPLPEALAEGGVKPFNVQQMIPFLKRIGRPRAQRILTWLLKADLDLKGASALPDRIIVERLLAQLAGKA